MELSLGFPIAEEMLVDELIDRRLVGRFHLLELQAHPDPAVGPRNPRFGIDLGLRARQLEPRASRMKHVIWLVPIALGMGLVGLMAFLWSMRSGQYEDLDGAAERILLADEADAPLRQAGWTGDEAMNVHSKQRTATHLS